MRVPNRILLINIANTDFKWQDFPQASRKEFRHGAVETIHGNSNISRAIFLRTTSLWVFELEAALQSVCIDKVVHTVLRPPGE